MLKLKFKFLVLIILSITAGLSYSSEYIDSDKYKKLKILIDKKNYQQALHIAEQQNEFLGDVYFDFLYGLASFHTNHIEEASFAFERVVINKPDWLDAQFYLATSYFKMANYHAAIKLCQSIIDDPRSSEKLKTESVKVQQASENKLAHQSTQFKQYISINSGYDSNINAGVNEDELPLLGQNILLSEKSKEINDSYIGANYRFNLNQPLNQKAKLHYSATINSHHFFTESDYNRLNLDAFVNYHQKLGQFDTSIGVRSQPLWLDGDFYRHQTSINTTLSKDINALWKIASAFNWGITKNHVDESLTTDDIAFSISTQYQSNNFRHMLTLGYIQKLADTNDNDHISRKSNSVGYNNIWLINEQWLASTTLFFQHREYQGKHPFYLAQQVDNMWGLSTMVQYQFSKKIAYRLNINVQDKDSNLPLFSYQRFDIGLSAVMSF